MSTSSPAGLQELLGSRVSLPSPQHLPAQPASALSQHRVPLKESLSAGFSVETGPQKEVTDSAGD